VAFFSQYYHSASGIRPKSKSEIFIVRIS